VRVACVVLGGLVALGWLVLPLARAGGGDPVTVARSAPVIGQGAVAAGPGQDETATGDLVLPLVALGAAAVLGVYGYARRARRARTRTTPGGGGPHDVPAIGELDRRARRLLVDIDDCVRTSAEELGVAIDQFGDEAVEPYAAALAYAKSELAAAFRLRQGLDDTAPGDSGAVLEEVIARCTDAGRRLDAEAAGFDQLRALERDAAGALEHAETRVRAIAARVPAAETALGELHKRYAPSACLPVAGHVEQAKDRLLIATARLDQARQALGRDDGGRAATHLRAAEAAVGQAAVLVDGVDRLAGELGAAQERLPVALDAVEAELAQARGAGVSGGGGMPAGPVARAASLLAGVRRESGAGPYDPLDALRRVAAAGVALSGGRAGALLDHALLPARSVATTVADVVSTHPGVVDSEARVRLAEAERLLAPGSLSALADVQRADDLALQARRLAERDVRTYGNPSRGREGEGPASFGGPRTRWRRIPHD
jgi:hypothetical protein